MVLKLGQMAETSRRFTARDVADYVVLSGQIPIDGELPEPLIGALFSYLLGMRLPGMGTNYLKQETEFKATAHIDENLIARVEISRLRPAKHLVDLRTNCRNENGILICDGRALVYIEDVPHGRIGQVGAEF